MTTPVTLSPVPYQQYSDAAGVPLVGGFVYTYLAGTTTPATTYADGAGMTPNPNPVVLDIRGGAAIWLQNAVAYKMVLTDALGNQIWSADNILGQGSMAQQDASNVAITGGTISGVTISGATINGNVNGQANGVSGVVAIANGGTGSTTAALARAALVAAASGSNSDITALLGLTTPLAVSEGGTGQTTLAGLIAALGITSISNIVAANPGSIQLGSLIIKFGEQSSTPSAGPAGVTATFNAPFPTGAITSVASVIGSGAMGDGNTSFTRSALTSSGVTYQWPSGYTGLTGYSYIAIGH
jgi:hypothetical protein